MAFPFLTARWTNLVNLTYAVDPNLLEPHVPDGCTLDVHNGDAFASLVAFDFLETKVFGIGWPGFRDFPELNLRFYVKRGDQRGVVFIKEFVPQKLVARMANAFYNEPYHAAKMDSTSTSDDVSHRFELGITLDGQRHSIRAQGTFPTYTPPRDTLAHYFKEHKWGFGRDHKGKTLAYAVEHPEWEIWDLQSWSLDLDPAALYGKEWGFMANQKPFSALFAVGSRVSVYPKSNLADVSGEPMLELPQELRSKCQTNHHSSQLASSPTATTSCSSTPTVSSSEATARSLEPSSSSHTSTLANMTTSCSPTTRPGRSPRARTATTSSGSRSPRIASSLRGASSHATTAKTTSRAPRPWRWGLGTRSNTSGAREESSST